MPSDVFFHPVEWTPLSVAQSPFESNKFELFHSTIVDALTEGIWQYLMVRDLQTTGVCKFISFLGKLSEDSMEIT